MMVAVPIPPPQHINGRNNAAMKKHKAIRNHVRFDRFAARQQRVR